MYQAEVDILFISRALGACLGKLPYGIMIAKSKVDSEADRRLPQEAKAHAKGFWEQEEN